MQLLQLNSEALQILAQGPHIQYILHTPVDLRGVNKLAERDILDMHWAFNKMQILGKAQPVVTVWLPFFELSEALCMVDADSIAEELEPLLLYWSHNAHRVQFQVGIPPVTGTYPLRLAHHLFTEYE